MSFLEIGMLVGFGAAWPMNIYKSLTSRTAAGRSLTFQWAIIYSNDVVLYLYVLNLLMVSTDTVLCYRNRRLDRIAQHV